MSDKINMTIDGMKIHFLKGNANKKYEDNTSSSGRHSPEWKDICHAARLR